MDGKFTILMAYENGKEGEEEEKEEEEEERGNTCKIMKES